ncbi:MULTISPECIES: MFS transporter [unclassified Meiothermus]|uniref:MFS transporter n=1 Tax=unclassified Meiothermus TaxID=370471 RepID=UPI000D7CEA74|nr:MULTISPECIES: MFS transporter [unclassified Meiothermus]PZA06709.1 hypothetical protein DNA98_12000 [Meiothermus sp. Pnk-1]RYM36635.1 MFS transporter [Meiothermus sp. PNK-Is4]
MNHPLKNIDFRWLLASRVAGNLSLGFAEVPLMWWVLETTGQASLVATVALIGAIGALIAAPLGGVWADRGHKRHLIQFTYAADALVQLAMIWGIASGHLELWGVYVLVGLASLFGNLRSPALGALQPLLLEPNQYQQGNAVMSLATTLGMAASFALAGTATGFLGVAGALWVGLGLVVLAALLLIPIREPQVLSHTAHQQPARAMLEGLRFIRRTPVVFWIVVIAMLINLILAPFGALAAPYAKGLGGGAADYGLLTAALMVGQLAGLVMMNFIRMRNPFLTFLLGTWGLAGGVGLLAVAPHLIVALALLALFGVAASFMNVQAMTLAQQAIPKEMMGRVFGVLQGLNMGVQPLGLATTSGLLAVMGVRSIFAAMGALMLLASLAWFQRPVRSALKIAGAWPERALGGN